MSWSIFLQILEGFSYIATVLGVIGVFVALKAYRNSQVLERKKDKIEVENAKNKRVQNSIDVLRSFATNIIPSISEQENNWPSVFVQTKEDIVNQINNDFKTKGSNTTITEKELTDDIIQKITTNAKMKVGMSDTLNNLEQLSIYMNYGMVEDDLTYPVIHHVFLNFIDKNNDVLLASQSDEAPFANIHQLYDSWKKRNKIDNIDKKRKQLDNEKKKLETES